MQEKRDYSVIVLCHNEQHIGHCINSIRCQLKGRDEIIIVNDHSDEDCRKLLQNQAQEHQITLINAEKKRGNRSHNRNLGASVATNDILIFIDGDIYFPEPVFHLMQNMLDVPGTVAVYSSIYGHSSSKFVLDSLLGFDYTEHLFDPRKWAELKTYDFLQDRRDKKSENLINGEMSWNYLYTSCAMITKEAFEQVGGFDETFEQWGAEDVDLGYRLAQIGKLKYCRELSVFHLPHQRDWYRDQLTNRANMYYMLDKYRTHIFELKIIYEKNLDLLSCYDELLRVMRAYEPPKRELPCYAQCLRWHPISHNNPNGLIEFTDSHGTTNHMALLGIALPFPSGCFDAAYLPCDLFQYPRTLIPKIFQEFSRVAKKVFMEPVRLGTRIHWDSTVVKAFGRNSPFKKVYYSSDNLQDFIYEPCDGWILVKPAFRFYRGE